MTSKDKFLAVKAAREGGYVNRCHTLPRFVGDYTVGKHSYDATNLVLLLHPNPSMNLVKAVMWHDLGERWVGDAPYPAVRADAKFAEAYRRLEKAGMERHGITIPDLTLEEQQWLNAVDKIELLLWAWEQQAMGNTNVLEYLKVLTQWVEDVNAGGTFPEILWDFINNYNHERLSDVS